MEQIKKVQRTTAFPWFYILIFLIFSAAIISAGILSFNFLFDRATEDKKSELTSILNLKTRQILNWQNERISEARFFHNNTLFKQQVSNYLKNPTSETGRNINTFLATIKESHYRAISIFTPDGKEIYRIGESSMPITKEDLDSTLRLGSFWMSDLILNEKNNLISIKLFTPLFFRIGNIDSLIAVMKFNIDPYKDFYPMINELPGKSTSTEAVLIRRDGDSMQVLNDLRHIKNSALRYRRSINDEKLLSVRVIKGHRGVDEGIDYKGDKVLSAVGIIPGTGWFLIIKIDQSEVYDSIFLAGSLIGLIILTLLIATGTSIALNARKKEYASVQKLYRKEQEKLALKEHYENVVKQANDVILLLDYNGKIIDANQKAVDVYGYSIDELLKMDISSLRLKGEKDNVKTLLSSDKEGFIYESSHCKKNGEVIYVEISARIMDISGTRFIQNIIRDISSRKFQEFKVKKLNRVYAVISEVNQAIVKTTVPGSLFQQICNISIGAGEFQAVCYVTIDEGTKRIEIIASAGEDREYFDKLNSIFVSVEGQGPMETALSKGIYFISNDLVNSDVLMLWKNEAVKRGYKSLGAFPIKKAKSVSGALLFFSEEKDFFSKEEIRLLDEITNNISYAMQMIEHEQKRNIAENALRKSELNLKTLAANIPATNIFMFNKNLEILIAEGSELGIFKTNVKSLKGKDISTLLPTGENLHEKLLQVFNDQKSEEEIKINGSIYSIKIHPIKNDSGEIFSGIAVLQNITSRVKSEEALKESESKLSGFFHLNNVYMSVVELRGNDIYFVMPNKKIAELFNMSQEELPGHSLRELSGEEINNYWLDIYRNIWKYKRPISIEFSIKQGDSTLQLIAEISAIEYEEGGNPLFSYSAFDITDRKKNQK